MKIYIFLISLPEKTGVKIKFFFLFLSPQKTGVEIKFLKGAIYLMSVLKLYGGKEIWGAFVTCTLLSTEAILSRQKSKM